METDVKREKTIKVLSFGEIIWDVYSNKKTLGGAPLNFAGHLVKSGCEGYLLSAVGKDELGEFAKKAAEKIGVNCKYIGLSDKPTGICNVTLDSNGLPQYEISLDVAYDDVKFSKNLLDEKFDALSFGTLALRKKNNVKVLKKIIESGKIDILYCDLNLRYPFYNSSTVEFCLSLATILKINEDELRYISNDLFCGKNRSPKSIVKEIFNRFKNIEVLILTCGKDGAYAFTSKDSKESFCPAKKVEVKSTVGAGDSFGAVFLANYLRGEAISQCLSLAAIRSAYVVSKYEAIPD